MVLSKDSERDRGREYFKRRQRGRDTLKGLLREPTFVDYFNIFLNLPVFGQRALFKLHSKVFTFSPPVGARIENLLVLDWLCEERYTAFTRTRLAHEFQLCQLLQKITLSLRFGERDSGPHLMRIFLTNLIGHVAGMYLFREFLRGTVGSRVIACWMHVQAFRKTRDPQRRVELFRSIRRYYLHPVNVIRAVGGCWRDIVASELLNFHVVPAVEDSVFKAKINDSRPISARELEPKAPEALEGVQLVLLTALQSYWLPCYVLHVLATQNMDILKQLAKTSQDDEVTVDTVKKLVQRCKLLMRRSTDEESDDFSTPSLPCLSSASCIPFTAELVQGSPEEQSKEPSLSGSETPPRVVLPPLEDLDRSSGQQSDAENRKIVSVKSAEKTSEALSLSTECALDLEEFITLPIIDDSPRAASPGDLLTLCGGFPLEPRPSSSQSSNSSATRTSNDQDEDLAQDTTAEKLSLPRIGPAPPSLSSSSDVQSDGSSASVVLGDNTNRSNTGSPHRDSPTHRDSPGSAHGGIPVNVEVLPHERGVESRVDKESLSSTSSSLIISMRATTSNESHSSRGDTETASLRDSNVNWMPVSSLENFPSMFPRRRSALSWASSVSPRATVVSSESSLWSLKSHISLSDSSLVSTSSNARQDLEQGNLLSGSEHKHRNSADTDPQDSNRNARNSKCSNDFSDRSNKTSLPELYNRKEPGCNACSASTSSATSFDNSADDTKSSTSQSTPQIPIQPYPPQNIYKTTHNSVEKKTKNITFSSTSRYHREKDGDSDGRTSEQLPALNVRFSSSSYSSAASWSSGSEEMNNNYHGTSTPQSKTIRAFGTLPSVFSQSSSLTLSGEDEFLSGEYEGEVSYSTAARRDHKRKLQRDRKEMERRRAKELARKAMKRRFEEWKKEELRTANIDHLTKIALHDMVLKHEDVHQLGSLLVHYVFGARDLAAEDSKTDRRTLCLLACEPSAGSLLRNYLVGRDQLLNTVYLDFWTSMRRYIQLRDMCSTGEATSRENRTQIFRLLEQQVEHVTRAFLRGAARDKLFNLKLRRQLLEDLTNKRHTTLVNAVMDVVANVLSIPVTQYVLHDLNTFHVNVLKTETLEPETLTQTSSTLELSSMDHGLPLERIPSGLFRLAYRREKCMRFRTFRDRRCLSDPWMDEPETEVTAKERECVKLNEQHRLKAFQYLVMISEDINTGELCDMTDLTEMIWSDFGSLHIRTTPRVRNRFLRSLLPFQRLTRHQMETLTRATKAILNVEVEMDEDMEEMDKETVGLLMGEHKTSFGLTYDMVLRLSKRRGAIDIPRPPRPKQFSDLLTEEYQYIFFRLYLISQGPGNIDALNFWKACEVAKNTNGSEERSRLFDQIRLKYLLGSRQANLLVDPDYVLSVGMSYSEASAQLLQLQNQVEEEMEKKWWLDYVLNWPDLEEHFASRVGYDDLWRQDLLSEEVGRDHLLAPEDQWTENIQILDARTMLEGSSSSDDRAFSTSEPDLRSFTDSGPRIQLEVQKEVQKEPEEDGRTRGAKRKQKRKKTEKGKEVSLTPPEPKFALPKVGFPTTKPLAAAVGGALSDLTTEWDAGEARPAESKGSETASTKERAMRRRDIKREKKARGKKSKVEEDEGARKKRRQKILSLWVRLYTIINAFSDDQLQNSALCYQLGLWVRLCKIINTFVATLRDPIEMRLFEAFLRGELEITQARTQAGPFNPDKTTYARLTTVNMLIVVNKLPSDLRFWVEVDRYKQQALEAEELMEEIPGVTDSLTQFISMRANAIISCYLNSVTPPMVQVNISDQEAFRIAHIYSKHGAVADLFHSAFVRLTPLLLNLWKQYQFSRDIKSKLYKLEGPHEYLGDLPHRSEASPDYTHCTVKDYNTIHVDFNDPHLKIRPVTVKKPVIAGAARAAPSKPPTPTPDDYTDQTSHQADIADSATAETDSVSCKQDIKEMAASGHPEQEGRLKFSMVSGIHVIVPMTEEVRKQMVKEKEEKLKADKAKRAKGKEKDQEGKKKDKKASKEGEKQRKKNKPEDKEGKKTKTRDKGKGKAEKEGETKRDGKKSKAEDNEKDEDQKEGEKKGKGKKSKTEEKEKDKTLKKGEKREEPKQKKKVGTEIDEEAQTAKSKRTSRKTAGQGESGKSSRASTPPSSPRSRAESREGSIVSSETSGSSTAMPKEKSTAVQKKKKPLPFQGDVGQVLEPSPRFGRRYVSCQDPRSPTTVELERAFRNPTFLEAELKHPSAFGAGKFISVIDNMYSMKKRKTHKKKAVSEAGKQEVSPLPAIRLNEPKTKRSQKEAKVKADLKKAMDKARALKMKKAQTEKKKPGKKDKLKRPSIFCDPKLLQMEKYLAERKRSISDEKLKKQKHKSAAAKMVDDRLQREKEKKLKGEGDFAGKQELPLKQEGATAGGPKESVDHVRDLANVLGRHHVKMADILGPDAIRQIMKPLQGTVQPRKILSGDAEVVDHVSTMVEELQQARRQMARVLAAESEESDEEEEALRQMEKQKVEGWSHASLERHASLVVSAVSLLHGYEEPPMRVTTPDMAQTQKLGKPDRKHPLKCQHQDEE